MGGLLAEFNSLKVSNEILYRYLVLSLDFPFNVINKSFNWLSYRFFMC